jgi:hypothetical protein
MSLDEYGIDKYLAEYMQRFPDNLAGHTYISHSLGYVPGSKNYLFISFINKNIVLLKGVYRVYIQGVAHIPSVGTVLKTLPPNFLEIVKN